MSTKSKEFELAVRSFHRDLYRFAFWLSRDSHVAEDLVQECFQKAWEHWESLRDAIAVKKWLFTILRRAFLRRMERKEFDSVDEDMYVELAMEQADADEAYTLRQILATTPDSLREPLLMQVLGGFSAEELAEIHQTTIGAITTRLSRARQYLRSQLQSEGVVNSALDRKNRGGSWTV